MDDHIIPNKTYTSYEPPQNTDSNTSTVSTQTKYKKIMILSLFFTLIVVVASVVFVVTSMNTEKSSTSPAQATAEIIPTQVLSYALSVEYVEGDVWKVAEGRRMEVISGDKLQQGDGIITEEGARLGLLLPDGSVIRIDESSEIIVSILSTDQIRIIDNQGLVYIALQPNESRSFAVLAGETTVTALGTVFSVENTDKVKVNVYESKVLVEKEGANVEVAEAQTFEEDQEAPQQLPQGEVQSSEFLVWSLEQERSRLNQEIIAMIQQQANLDENATKEEEKAALQAGAAGIDKKQLQQEAFRNSTSGNLGAINLSAEKVDAQTVKLNWGADGLANNGFRMVWSQNQGPTYPRRSGDKGTSKDVYGYEKHISIKPGSGTWYFRVCESLGETCGVYSNEVSLSF